MEIKMSMKEQGENLKKREKGRVRKIFPWEYEEKEVNRPFLKKIC